MKIYVYFLKEATSYSYCYELGLQLRIAAGSVFIKKKK